MGLLQDWREYAYGVELDSPAGKAIWDKYFKEEKVIYEELLAEPSNVVTGTVRELAEKYNMELKYMVGFLDGINDSLKNPNPIDDMTEDTVVSLDIDLEKLYYKCQASSYTSFISCIYCSTFFISKCRQVYSGLERTQLATFQKRSGNGLV